MHILPTELLFQGLRIDQKCSVKIESFSPFFILVINLPWSTTYGPVALTNLDGTGVYHHYGGVSEITTDGTSWSFSDHYTIQNQNHGCVSWPNIIPIPDTMANCS